MKKLILLLLLWLPIKLFAPHYSIKFNYKEYKICTLKQSTLTLENLKEYVKILEIKHPDVVTKQFILETGWGNSYVCKKFNNLFGFRNSNGYFKYNHWTESVESYKRFQNRKYKGGSYYQFLEKIGYSEASNYIQVLKTIFVN